HYYQISYWYLGIRIYKVYLLQNNNKVMGYEEKTEISSDEL
ncbi:unnamed protein product, partial [marine sediment metagenome]